MGNLIKNLRDRKWRLFISTVVNFFISSFGGDIVNEILSRYGITASGFVDWWTDNKPLFFLIIFIIIVFIIAFWPEKSLNEKQDSKSYKKLELCKDDNGEYSSEHARAGAGLSDHIRLWLIATNGKRSLYECRVVLDNLEFLGNNTCSNWITTPGGFERKAMKWDDGSLSGNGETNFSKYEKKVLEIARVNKSKRIMELSHSDGYSKKTQNQSGKYRFTLKVYANSKYVIIIPIKPITYIVTIKYEEGSSIIRIEDIKREE